MGSAHSFTALLFTVFSFLTSFCVILPPVPVWRLLDTSLGQLGGPAWPDDSMGTPVAQLGERSMGYSEPGNGQSSHPTETP